MLRAGIVGLPNIGKTTLFNVLTGIYAPDSGEHTKEVLQEFGFDAKTVDDLKQRGII